MKAAVEETTVSIHAPVMDAKNGFDDEVIDTYVSIHAPVMDANALRINTKHWIAFQSTRP